MKFTDRKGREWILTRVQALYLSEGARHRLECGWGGMSSTLTVRLLEERGLITLARSSRAPHWTITDLTALGVQVLDRWREIREAS